jgi:hypothetical protein
MRRPPVAPVAGRQVLFSGTSKLLQAMRRSGAPERRVMQPVGAITPPWAGSGAWDGAMAHSTAGGSGGTQLQSTSPRNAPSTPAYLSSADMRAPLRLDASSALTAVASVGAAATTPPASVLPRRAADCLAGLEAMTPAEDVPVYVMLPLDTVNAEGVFRYAGTPWFAQALQVLSLSGVHGVAVDVWVRCLARAALQDVGRRVMWASKMRPVCTQGGGPFTCMHLRVPVAPVVDPLSTAHPAIALNLLTNVCWTCLLALCVVTHARIRSGAPRSAAPSSTTGWLTVSCLKWCVVQDLGYKWCSASMPAAAASATQRMCRCPVGCSRCVCYKGACDST